MKKDRLIRALLFPPAAILIILVPLSGVLLVCSMTSLPQNDPLRIASYIVAFAVLCLVSLRIPRIVRYFKNWKNRNRFIGAWVGDARLRLNVTLIAGGAWNFLYAALQLGMGVYHRSAWFSTLCVYYLSLGIMRLFLVRHTVRHLPGEKMTKEWKQYRLCGYIFLLMNLAMSCMMLYMIRKNRVTHHSEITTIALAAYTFTTLTVAVINVVKYRKYKSPAMSAAKAISLAAACVSILTLENTMLTTFSGEELTVETRRLFLGLSGGGISVFIVAMALYMIISAGRRIKSLEK